MGEEPEYTVRMSTSGVSSLYDGSVAFDVRPKQRKVLALLKPHTSEVSNKEIEKLLKGLLVAFENAYTNHYCVKKAKTSIVTTRNAEGKLEVSLGLNIFKLFDAQGNVKGERTEGIEIEIERIEKHRTR